MRLPICNFDAKNRLLCPQCETKLEDGRLTRADIDASFKLAKLAKNNAEIEKFTLFSCKEIRGNLILTLAKDDILATRHNKGVYKLLEGEFEKKIWLVDEDTDVKNFIKNLLFPTKVVSINPIWRPGGIEKTRTIISGRYTANFPIDLDRVIELVKSVKNLDIEIDFEEKIR